MVVNKYIVSYGINIDIFTTFISINFTKGYCHMRKIATFCGHGDIKKEQKAHYNGVDGELCDILKEVIIDCIIKYGITEFYSSGLGSFDNLGAKTVFELQKEDEYSNIKSVRVLYEIPEEKTEVERENENVYEHFANYHETVICEGAEKGFPQGRIPKCNKYMIKSSDVVIACVNRSAVSNSYKNFLYAQKQGKIVINLLDFQE